MLLLKTTETIKSYAKLNLDLEVRNFNPTLSLHSIFSEMIEIDIYETLQFHIELCDDAKIFDFSQQPLEQGCKTTEESSIFKALRLWCNKKNIGARVQVKHDDAIPAGKGLGVASSNAGCAILLLEKLAESIGIKRLDDKSLAALSLSVGSDVPFFTLGKTHANISGCGEVVKPVKDKCKNEFLLHIPPHSSGTTNAYKNLYKENKKVYSSFLEIEQNKKYYEYLISQTGLNEWRLTGSGSAFFIEVKSPKLLEESKKWKNINTLLVKQRESRF